MTTSRNAVEQKYAYGGSVQNFAPARNEEESEPELETFEDEENLCDKDLTYDYPWEEHELFV